MAVSIPQLQADLAAMSLVVADLRAQLKAAKAKPARIIEVPVDRPVRVIKTVEVPVEKIVYRDTPAPPPQVIEKVVYRDRVVQSPPKVIETVREVIKEVPVEVIKYKRRTVVKEVPQPPRVIVQSNPADAERIEALTASNARLRARIADLEANPIIIEREVMVE
jgi:hypothetical protein